MSPVALQDRAREALATIDAQQRRRQRQEVVSRRGIWARCTDGESRRVFCSNDYLGLADDPRVRDAAARAGSFGSTASQHVCGFHAEQRALEDELADRLGAQRALVGGSGYALNTGVIPVLAGREDGILADALNHASLIDGCRLSRARVGVYAHADVADLARCGQQLQAEQRTPALVVTDAVFSMDGDVAPLPALRDYAATHDAGLYVDDAHGFGWAGEGRGSVAAAGLAPNALVQLVTFGKALGGYGAAVAGAGDVMEWLLQRSRTTLFATALPVPVLAAARAALRITIDEADHRQQLQHNIRALRAACARENLTLLPGESPIQALVLGPEARALAWQRALWQAGFWVNAIRPPTVPPGTSRLRITLSARHGANDIAALVAALAEIAAREADPALTA